MIKDYCDLCGEEIGQWDCEYVSNNPNESDIAREQAVADHSRSCSAAWDRHAAELASWWKELGIEGLAPKVFDNDTVLALIKTGHISEINNAPSSPYGDWDAGAAVPWAVAKILGFETEQKMVEFLEASYRQKMNPLKSLRKKLREYNIPVFFSKYLPASYISWPEGQLIVELAKDSISIHYSH